MKILNSIINKSLERIINDIVPPVNMKGRAVRAWICCYQVGTPIMSVTRQQNTIILMSHDVDIKE